MNIYLSYAGDSYNPYFANPQFWLQSLHDPPTVGAKKATLLVHPASEQIQYADAPSNLLTNNRFMASNSHDSR